MAQTHKMLGQSKPSANTNTTVYTVPGGTIAIISGIFVANVGSALDTIRIFAVPSGDSAGVANAIYHDISIPDDETLLVNGALTLDAGDFLVVFALNGDITFTVSGLEIT